MTSTSLPRAAPADRPIFAGHAAKASYLLLPVLAGCAGPAALLPPGDHLAGWR